MYPFLHSLKGSVKVDFFIPFYLFTNASSLSCNQTGNLTLLLEPCP